MLDPFSVLILQRINAWLAYTTVAVSGASFFQPVVNAEQLPTTISNDTFTGCPKGSFENINVFYLDPASEIFRALYPAIVPTQGCGKVVGVNVGSSRSIAIYGDPEGRESLKRYIGSFDLPRERVNMDLWAIQISSTSPAKLTDVMGQVQRVVDQTREAMQETYKHLSELSYRDTTLIPEDPYVSALGKYQFSDALALEDKPPSLSLTQMLLRLNFADNPIHNYNRAAVNICEFFVKEKGNDPKFKLFNEFEGKELKAYDVQRIFNDDPPRSYRRPFQGFMTVGLKQDFDPNSVQPSCGDGAIKVEKEAQELEALARRKQAIIRFAKEYKKFQDDRQTFNPSELAKTASIVDGMVGPTVDAINRDIEAYFIRPTLFKIRQIVGRNRGVEYAEVGRSIIAGINGQTAKLVSGTVSSFDDPTPLRLGNWLTKANAYLGTQQTPGAVPNVLPNFTGPKAGTLGALAPSLSTSNLPLVGSLLSTLPTQNAVALLAALSDEEVRWQSLSSGIRLDLTPTLMRDQTQAEVKVDLTIADPATLAQTKNPNDPTQFNNVRFEGSDNVAMRPLSRISKSIIDTKVYVNTMDLFALSTFNNQTTITGRRWYVPLIGTIWEGAFGDIPVVGGWFSFKRFPQNVQYQSIILTNTLIVPSAMGMASYFNNNKDKSADQLTIPSLGSQQLLEAIPRSKRPSPGSR
ncbi:MAG: hypothetical protein ACKOOH_07350 [Cyanobium sp.]